MAGQRANFSIKGSNFEIAANNILCPILNLTKFHWENDFGIDFYCSVLLESGKSSQTTRDLFALQVGGPGKALEYGGFDGKNEYKKHEIDWLKSLTTPFLYGRVSSDRQRIDLYTLAPAWQIFVRSPEPFKIEFEFQDPSAEGFTLPTPEPDLSQPPVEFGDGRTWRINLGPPIISRTGQELENEKIKEETRTLLRDWLQIDWINVMRFHSGIALTEAFMSWCTNQPGLRGQRMSWSSFPGANVAALATALQPPLINLGANLQYQDNPGAFSLIPLLGWLQDQGILHKFGKGLMEQLKEAQTAGMTPAKVLAGKSKK
jgi:hypothetical protein